MGAYDYEAVGPVEKAPDTSPVTYRVIRTIRLSTFKRELEDAAAGEFRLVAFALGPKAKLAVLAR